MRSPRVHFCFQCLLIRGAAEGSEGKWSSGICFTAGGGCRQQGSSRLPLIFFAKTIRWKAAQAQQEANCKVYQGSGRPSHEEGNGTCFLPFIGWGAPRTTGCRSKWNSCPNIHRIALTFIGGGAYFSFHLSIYSPTKSLEWDSSKWSEINFRKRKKYPIKRFKIFGFVYGLRAVVPKAFMVRIHIKKCFMFSYLSNLGMQILPRPLFNWPI